jgi:hypothetical protein
VIVGAEDRGQGQGGAGAVHQAVLDLQDERLTTPFKPVDKREPPQRAAPVEVLLCEVSVQTVELRIPTGGRERSLAKVVVKVEGGRIHKHGVVEAEGDRFHDQPELRQCVQSHGHVAAEVVEGEAHRCSLGGPGWAEDGECHGVHGVFGKLHGEKAGIETGEATHSHVVPVHR